jgi:hypothetical protein
MYNLCQHKHDDDRKETCSSTMTDDKGQGSLSTGIHCRNKFDDDREETCSSTMTDDKRQGSLSTGIQKPRPTT